jgi:hypothetical protein
VAEEEEEEEEAHETANHSLREYSRAFIHG